MFDQLPPAPKNRALNCFDGKINSPKPKDCLCSAIKVRNKQKNPENACACVHIGLSLSQKDAVHRSLHSWCFLSATKRSYNNYREMARHENGDRKLFDFLCSYLSDCTPFLIFSYTCLDTKETILKQKAR